MQQIVKMKIGDRTYKVLARQIKSGVALKLVNGDPPRDANEWANEASVIDSDPVLRSKFLRGQVVKL